LSSISATVSAVSALLSPPDVTASGPTGPSTATASTETTPSAASGLLSGLLGEKTPLDALIAREKQCLSEAIEFLEIAVPDMGETRLLKDALLGLEEPFLLVVVGEFNSGKSTVINALLGAKYLEEGILPTTNEISILKHADDQERTERVRALT
jgi:ABC-type transport system involved in cytochrome bd biosynthesis fused ATPase/permease subunit